MPRFHFDLEGDGTLIRDVEGAELADREAVEREALVTLAEIAPSLSRKPKGQREIVLSVKDNAGRKVYRATLSLTGRWID